MSYRTAAAVLALVAALAAGAARAEAAYNLTIESGSGDGTYNEGQIVSIAADPAPSGHVFNMWAGDPEGFNDWAEMKTSSATYEMPAEDMTLTATYKPTSSPYDWWPYFDAFCREEFGAELEPLTYDMFGMTLSFMSVSGSEWRHISETSACIAFETNLPAKAYVEYGQTTGYGSQTSLPDGGRHYYLHVHHLKNLQQNTLYHYRYVAEDERGNVIYSADKTFTTATPANVIYVPAGVSGPPYNLTQSGKTYLLTQDIVCNRTAFNINASNITLDLGGHAVVYNQEDYQVSSDYRDTSSMGVRAVSRSGIKVVNGFITQGLGYNTADDSSIGYSPATLWSCSGELAGVSIDYAGPQVTGFRLDYSSSLTVHHNVVLDRGGDVDDRHTSPKAIKSGGDLHHNLVKRHRQIAYSPSNSTDEYNNEIYVDSCATNGAGIMYYKTTNASAYGNRIFGTGYLMIGISTVSSGIADVMVHDNFIHLQATRPDDRWPEYGAQSGAYCCRITWGGDNIQYYDNTMVTYGRDGGMVRGTWFYAQPSIVDCVYRDNTLKAVLENMTSDIQGCIVHVGGGGDPNAAPIVYDGNRLISNFCNARMGEDYYGAGCNAEFYDNTFVKEGPARPDYRTIGVGYGTFRSSGHKFFDSVFEGGASYDEVRFDGSGIRDFRVGWTLTVETEAYADIEIRDLSNSLVYTGQSDGNGLDSTLLYEYMEQSSGRTYETPHSVKVTKGVDTVTESVTVDEKKTVQIWFGASYALTVNSGSGSGNYTEGAVVGISAGSAPSGKDFSVWTGDVAYVADPYSATTTVTMPAMAVEVTATYVDHGYSLTVTNGNGTGVYQPTTVVPISADAPASGKLFSRWIGDTSHLSDAYSASTTVTMPADDISVTATYAWAYSLTVHSGTGSGLYLYSTVVDIQADPAGTNMQFDEWIGDTDHVADVQEGTTTFTMPSHACEVMATYEVILPGDLDGSGMVGQGDLDIILDQWGRSGGEITDPRADANDDDFIGQKDLDIVLDHWGESI